MTDQDRKDHELAAKAAGYVLTWKEGSCKGGAYCGAFIERGGELVAWRPKEDNADAFALMVDCAMSVHYWMGDVRVSSPDRLDDIVIGLSEDPFEATHLAVFRCAVEIGRAKQ